MNSSNQRTCRLDLPLRMKRFKSNSALKSDEKMFDVEETKTWQQDDAALL